MSLPAPMSWGGHSGTPQEVHGIEWHGRCGPSMNGEGFREEVVRRWRGTEKARATGNPGLWGGRGDRGGMGSLDEARLFTSSPECGLRLQGTQ